MSIRRRFGGRTDVSLQGKGGTVNKVWEFQVYSSRRRKRSSLSRPGQFEQPRQQTRSTATPTVTARASTVPFDANQ